MAFTTEHKKDCMSILGTDCENVHVFLDQYAEIFPIEVFSDYHRSFLHNTYGVTICRSIWGPVGEKAAIIHVVRDFVMEPIHDKTMKWVMKNSKKALVYFNNLENFQIHMSPNVINAWDNKSLCAIAFMDDGKDKHYRSMIEW